MNLISSTIIDLKGSKSKPPKEFKPKFVVKRVMENSSDNLKIPLNVNIAESYNSFYLNPNERWAIKSPSPTNALFKKDKDSSFTRTVENSNDKLSIKASSPQNESFKKEKEISLMKTGETSNDKSIRKPSSPSSLKKDKETSLARTIELPIPIQLMVGSKQDSENQKKGKEAILFKTNESPFQRINFESPKPKIRDGSIPKSLEHASFPRMPDSFYSKTYEGSLPKNLEKTCGILSEVRAEAECDEKQIEKEEPLNIFTVNRTFSSGLSIFDECPRFDEKGEIVKHTLLGKPEWFLKMQKSEKPKLSFLNSPTRRNETSPANGFSVNDITISSEILSQRKRGADDKSKFRTRATRITKQELIKQYEQIKLREQANLRAEEGNLNKYNLADRLQVTKEERVLEKFEQKKVIWKNIISKTVKMCNRKEDESVVHQADMFRKKKEIADTIEMSKTDAERQGYAYWRNNLRSYRVKENSGGDSDVNQTTREKSGVEVIRCTDNSFNSDKRASPRMKPFEKDKTYKAFFSNNKNDLTKFNVDLEDERDIEFVLKGNNVLEVEKKVFAKDSQGPDTLFRKFRVQEEEALQTVGETIIEENFDKKYLVKKGYIFPSLRK